MNNTILAVILAFVGYSALGLGQAGQKIGLAMTSRRRVAGWSLWAVTTLLTSVSFALVFVAISKGSVSLVGAMSGTGLVSVAIFGSVVMKERLTRSHLVSLAAIVAGAALVALLAQPGGDERNLVLLYGSLATGTVIYSGAALLTRGGSMTGVMLGGLSGFLGAYSQLFQRLGSGELPWTEGAGPILGAIVTDPITAIWVGLSILSMLAIQFSYRHGEATRIIPVFTANFIIVPVVGGVLVFGETLVLVAWIGVAAVLAGSVVLGRKRAASTPA